MRYLCVICLMIVACAKAYCQTGHLEDTLFMENNRDKVVISPNPVIGGEYFKIKFPERAVLKHIELLDLAGNKMDTTPVLFSKMGMYMPNVKKGEYLLRMNFSEDTIVRKIRVE